MTEFVNNCEKTTNDRICKHDWVNKAGAGYRATPVAICVKCHAEKRYCAKCGEKL